RKRLTLRLLDNLPRAALEQHGPSLWGRRSIKMLAKSITENTSGRGEHYITRNRNEYWRMQRSGAGGGGLNPLLVLK
ncbi:hypothetical protein PL75_11630, partial [Neisseria arctica]